MTDKAHETGGPAALRPSGNGWQFVAKYGHAFGWQHFPRDVRVLSSVDDVWGQLHYHVSVSSEVECPNDYVMRFVARAFGIPLDGEAESNDRVRHLWAPASVKDSKHGGWPRGEQRS